MSVSHQNNSVKILRPTRHRIRH